MKIEMNQRYKELLVKFYKDEDLRELLDLVTLERRRKEMIHYSKHNSYPEKVDGLDMLQLDLITVQQYYESQRG